MSCFCLLLRRWPAVKSLIKIHHDNDDISNDQSINIYLHLFLFLLTNNKEIVNISKTVCLMFIRQELINSFRQSPGIIWKTLIFVVVIGKRKYSIQIYTQLKANRETLYETEYWFENFSIRQFAFFAIIETHSLMSPTFSVYNYTFA